MFIVRGLRSNLLGLPAIKALNLATRLDETVSQSAPPLSERYIHDRFKKVFQGLGNLGEEYKIKLKTGATPFALFTPRRVALPLREKVEAELKRMETMGVISKVDAPLPGVPAWSWPRKNLALFEYASTSSRLTRMYSGRFTPYLGWTTRLHS